MAEGSRRNTRFALFRPTRVLDGFEGVIDLNPTIDRGRIFAFLQEPENFQKVRVSEYGHSVGWISDAVHETDFGTDNLRSNAENQAKLHKLVANMHL